MAKPRLTKAEQAQRTRHLLIEAAGKLYYEYGYAAVSLEDIAAEAGVTKGAVYAHFANKEALVTELMSTVESTAVDLSMFGASDSPGEEARAFARAVLAMVEPKMVAVQSEYISLALRNPRAGEVFAGVIHKTLAELGSRVDVALAAEPDRRFTGTDVVVIIDALLQGLMIRHALNPELAPDQLFEDALSLILSALIIGIADPDEAIALSDQLRRTSPAKD